MKTLSHSLAPARGAGNQATSPPVKVCMHLLSRSRTDIRVIRSATALVEDGYDVSIIDLESERTCPAEEAFGDIHVHHLMEPGWRASRRFEIWFFVKVVQTFIRSLWQLLRTPADIYHANDLTALPACYIAARLRRKPLIFEIYDLQFPIPETSVGFWRHLGKPLEHMLALILPHCRAVIATSPLHIRELQKRFHLKEAVLVRNMPHYRAILKNDRLRLHYGLGSEVGIALYQGNLQPDRGLDVLVRAATFLERGVVIVLMGRAVKTTLDQLESLIESLGVSDRVKIIPAVPYEELLDWTASADIGLIVHSPDYSLNVRTLLPNKFFEYLMAGLPVLSSPLDAIAEIIRTHEVGQVTPSLAPAELATAINTMLANREALVRMHCNALHAAQEFCWEKESQQLIRLYHSILANRSGSLRTQY